MIDAAAYATVAARFHAACEKAGFILEKSYTEAGQLRYREVTPTQMLGHLLSLGYRVSMIRHNRVVDARVLPDNTERTLRLIHPEVSEEE